MEPGLQAQIVAYLERLTLLIERGSITEAMFFHLIGREPIFEDGGFTLGSVRISDLKLPPEITNALEEVGQAYIQDIDGLPGELDNNMTDPLFMPEICELAYTICHEPYVAMNRLFDLCYQHSHDEPESEEELVDDPDTFDNSWLDTPEPSPSR